MNSEFILKNITYELNLNENSVKNTILLFSEGATIPFISRYRKERTGNLDETQITNIHQKLEYYTELESRKETILKTISELGKLTPGLSKQIKECTEKQILEDLYLPYKPKKRTKATIAKEKGLEALANTILQQNIITGTKETILRKYINKEKEVLTATDALQGTLDIIAEIIADNAAIRKTLREETYETGKLVTKVKKEWKEQKSKFEMYYDFSENIKSAASHRILAIRRGTKENILTWKIEINQTKALNYIESKIIKTKKSIFYLDLLEAIADSFKRLIFPSIETEVFNEKLKESETESILVFSKNLKNLLLAPPAGSKSILAIDPGFRTGCKIAVIDKKGDFKEYKAIFPHPPAPKTKEAETTILSFLKKYNVSLITIGNGTASKETRQFITDLIKTNHLDIPIIVVSEAGASVYSASPQAVKEFPDLDVTVRGAISIGRRLQDPLSELVKIDAKSIGVGQYQHDLNQTTLKKSLDLTVESCVNFVGAQLNTASAELLSYISGINKTLAQNIITYRTTNGPFKTRKELLKVPKLGAKAFEQSAGFLKIRESKNPLDNSSIHPESYKIVEKMAQDHNLELSKLIGNETLADMINIKNYVSESVGLPTLTDITNELKKPGLDPRKQFNSLEFSMNINKIEDLTTDMELAGTVTNVTNFGAFVDIGVHQDGLIHISNLSKKYIKNPYEIVSVGDTVQVKILSVDLKLKRIALKKMECNN